MPSTLSRAFHTQGPAPSVREAAPRTPLSVPCHPRAHGAALLTWYCAAGPAGPMGRKAAAPGPPTPPAGPGPLIAGPGSMPGPAGGGGAPRAAATAPPPGLSGGSGNPPAPRPDITPSRPAVQRSGLRAPRRVRSAIRAPGLSDLNSGFWGLLIRVPGFPNPSS